MSRVKSAVGGLERLIIQSLDVARIAPLATRLRGNDVILTYHAVETTPSGYRYGVAQERFVEQIDYLQRHYEIVSLAELFGETAKRPRVALTFDDAYADFYENVYPLLHGRKLAATVFIPTKFVGCDAGLLARDEQIAKPHMSWEQMQEIVAYSAVTFGSHTHSHLSAIDHLAEFEQDLARSIELIETHLGVPPAYFAYPYGLCNEESHQIALSCGFDKIFTMEDRPPIPGPVQGRLDIYERNQQLPYFKLTVAGLLGPAMRQRMRGVFKRS